MLGALTEIPLDGVSYGSRTIVLQWLLGGVIALLLVLPAVFARPASGGLPGRVLSARPVVWLGLVSYGIFLWQMGPLTWVLNKEIVSGGIWSLRFVEYASIVLATTIPLAAFSYYAVERPFLRFKDPRRRASSDNVEATWGP